MDEETKKLIKEKYDALPKSIQEVIISSDYENSLFEIGKKHQMTIEQMGIMEQNTTLVMMGLIPTENFERELTRELNIDTMKGRQIVSDINEKVFFRIRELLKLMNTPAGETPSVEETPEKIEAPIIRPAPTQINKNEATVLDQAGIKIVEPIGPSSSIQKEAVNTAPQYMASPAPKIDALEINAPVMPTLKTEAPNPILAQKLSDSFKIPATKTEHSLENISKPAPTTYPPKKDPYRVNPEE